MEKTISKIFIPKTKKSMPIKLSKITKFYYPIKIEEVKQIIEEKLYGSRNFPKVFQEKSNKRSEKTKPLTVKKNLFINSHLFPKFCEDKRQKPLLFEEMKKRSITPILRILKSRQKSKVLTNSLPKHKNAYSPINQDYTKQSRLGNSIDLSDSFSSTITEVFAGARYNHK